MTMDAKKVEQLEAMLTTCRDLGIDVRYRPEYGHFTAMVWEGWDHSYNEDLARSIQETIKEQTAQYPNLVCYCFDPFSTLVYTV